MYSSRPSALLEQDQGNLFSVKVFPLLPLVRIKFVLSFSLVASRVGGVRQFEVPLDGLPKTSLAFAVVLLPMPGETVRVTSPLGAFRFQPTSTLDASPSEPQLLYGEQSDVIQPKGAFRIALSIDGAVDGEATTTTTTTTSTTTTTTTTTSTTTAAMATSSSNATALPVTNAPPTVATMTTTSITPIAAPSVSVSLGSPLYVTSAAPSKNATDDELLMASVTLPASTFARDAAPTNDNSNAPEFWHVFVDTSASVTSDSRTKKKICD